MSDKLVSEMTDAEMAELAGAAPNPDEMRQAVIGEISLALDRCLDPELDVPEQVTRVVRSALRLATRLPVTGR